MFVLRHLPDAVVLCRLRLRAEVITKLRLSVVGLGALKMDKCNALAIASREENTHTQSIGG